MKQHHHDDTCRDDKGPCACLPQPVRMNYFHGQLISERDLRTEQTYFREKLRHMHRCVHGYGVICGMEVRAVEPPRDCLPDDTARRRELRVQIASLERDIAGLKAKASEARDDAQRRELDSEMEAAARERAQLKDELDGLAADRPDQDDDGCADRPPLHLIRVGCGAAIDCDGHDLILHADRIVDVRGLLKPSERDRLADGLPHAVYLSVCYDECGREPTRPFAMDECATTNAPQMARIAEDVRIVASLTPPSADERCEPCCACCTDACLLLAKLEVSLDEPITVGDIDHSVRRRFGLYDPTVITGISWKHNATYSAAVANGILGTKDRNGGIEITFSKPVHVSTITPGTIELLRITGGRGLAGVVCAMEGEFVGLPANGFVDRVRYRDTTNETVQPKDRIMVVVRTPFLLDRCCRAVEGLHVGGRVPRLQLTTRADETARHEEEYGAKVEPAICAHPPHGPMPWTTSGPGNFESWFWIAE